MQAVIPLTALIVSTTLSFGVSAQELTWSGQLRPRFEFRDPSLGGSESFTSMRTRVAVEAALDGAVTLFVQPQNVRVWGGDTHPLFDTAADAVDIHQAYIRVRGERLRWLTATIGRMEAPLGGQRLVGAVDWAQQGQSFDGVHLAAAFEAVRWSLVAFQVNDAIAPGVGNDRTLAGTYGTVEPVGPGALDVFWLWDRNRESTPTDEHFFGGRYVLDGEITARLEGTIATGTRSDLDVSAYMIGARVGTASSTGRHRVAFWYDYLSGDDPTTPEIEVFNTLFATNHKFYGFADLFLNIPLHTAGAGLQDFAMKYGWIASDRIRGRVDLHTFRATSGEALTDGHFGEEVDISVTHRHSSALSTTLGYSRVFHAAGLSEVGRLDEDMTWLYLMVNAVF